jgi:hypothetical protein
MEIKLMPSVPCVHDLPQPTYMTRALCLSLSLSLTHTHTHTHTPHSPPQTAIRDEPKRNISSIVTWHLPTIPPTYTKQ